MNIIINCERMKYANTGLFHFCLNLTNALHLQRKESYPQLQAYLPANRKELRAVDSINQRALHKVFRISDRHFNLWHETSQGEQYFPYRSKRRKVLTIHDLNVLLDESKSTTKKKYYIRHLQKQVDYSDAITTISEYSLETIRQHLNIRDKPINVIYNGCNVPEEIVLNKPAFIRDKLQYIFSIGTILRKKNFHVLPALLKGNDLSLVIAGEIVSKDYYNEIVTEAKRHGVLDRVIFTGPISENEKWWLYTNMKAFVFPSVAEGFGLPVIEAMNFGKPVILSKYTSLPEIGGNYAYYFNSFDAEEMRQQLHFAVTDFNSFAVKASDAIKHARSFNWNEAAKKYWQVYSSLLNFQL